MLTVEEVKNFLEIDQAQLETFLKAGKIHAYKIGGTFLRFRKEEILTLRSELTPKKQKNKNSFLSKLIDFWRFNNFYIISLVIMVVVAFFVIKF